VAGDGRGDRVRPAAGGPGTVVISAIGGTAGVGKTALALHWAHQVAAQFPDGQLYVNLRGFDPSGTPGDPAAAIRGFLDALGVPPGRIPPGPEAQAGLYRSLLADRRMLIVADNARDEQQVRPLLPASPGSLVLVTSRSQLSGLAAADGARLISLEVLSHTEAVQLLTARLGTARAAAEPGAIDQIARLCACLPLALAVAAARSAARPGFALTALAAELRDFAAAWMCWTPVIRRLACGQCSRGPHGSSPPRPRGCSGSWACTPDPTSLFRPPPAWPEWPSPPRAACCASWAART
jgi:hypothetical protein